jgi:IMP dehydrogenase
MKMYRGMGSLSAMLKSAASRERYSQGPDLHKLVPEGIESLVPVKGPVAKILQQLVGGLRSGMGYRSAETIQRLHEIADFRFMSNAGYTESAPHDVTIIDSSDASRWGGV